MQPEVLYIHGFASSPYSKKATQLRDYFHNLGYYNVITPQIPVAPLKAINFLHDIYEHNPLKLVIGSSLGGFYAIYLSQFFNIKTVLLNPALNPSQTLKDYIGTVKRHYSDEFFIWTQDHIEQLKELENNLDISKIDQTKLYFYLAKDDELLNFDNIPKLFPYATIKFFDNCKHSCTRFNEFLPELFNLYLTEIL